MSLFEGLSITDGWQRCRTDFHDAWSYSIVFWSPAQCFNFTVVPLQFNALTVNVFSMVWTAFLSYLHHKRDYGDAPHRTSSSTDAQRVLQTLSDRDRTATEQLRDSAAHVLELGLSAAGVANNASLRFFERGA